MFDENAERGGHGGREIRAGGLSQAQMRGDGYLGVTSIPHSAVVAPRGRDEALPKRQLFAPLTGSQCLSGLCHVQAQIRTRLTIFTCSLTRAATVRKCAKETGGVTVPLDVDGEPRRQAGGAEKVVRADAERVAGEVMEEPGRHVGSAIREQTRRRAGGQAKSTSDEGRSPAGPRRTQQRPLLSPRACMRESARIRIVLPWGALHSRRDARRIRRQTPLFPGGIES